MQDKPADRLPPLDLLASFEAAARHLSFTRAAAERFVTQSAMSRQMRALEDDLGLALFRRGHRTLALTEGGLRLQATCTALLQQLRITVRELRAPARREVLALTTTPGLASFWLIPLLPAFTRAHPGIDVRLDTTFDVRQLAAEGFDLAIRYTGTDAAQGPRLFNETALPVCSPKLLRRLPLRTPADLRQHTLLMLEPSITGGMPLEWEPWLRSVGEGGLDPFARLSFSGYNEVVAAAMAGQGVAMGRLPLVAGLLRQRRLVAPFDGALTTQRVYSLIVDPAAAARPAVRALAAWLLAQATPAPATTARPASARAAATPAAAARRRR